MHQALKGPVLSNRSNTFNSWQLTLLMGLLLFSFWGGAVLWAPVRPDFWMTAGLGCAIIGITWFDVDHYRIPDWISYPLILAGLVFVYMTKPSETLLHIMGALIGYGFIWMLNTYWRRKHGKDGIGMGDAKLLAGAGAWLGVFALPIVTLIASASALLVILFRALIMRAPVEAGQRIPFGPFIALGFWLVWLGGRSLGL